MFKLISEFKPGGDQPQAIEALIKTFKGGSRYATLLGVTGSGKTFTMAHLIQALDRPTLVISHNKTLAAQLYSEFREFFAENGVGYFVSYYDYYQPEAYIPQRDIYIEKDSSINEDIDRLRLNATSLLMTRRDVIIVASVSCIYGLGSPEDYQQMYLQLRIGQRIARDDILKRLVDIQYERNDHVFGRGNFRVRGDVIELYPTYEDRVYRIELFGDEVEALAFLHPLTGEVIETPRGDHGLPRAALRHAGEPHQRRRRAHRAGTRRAADRAEGPGQAAGDAAPRGAHALRHRDAARGGLLPGHRELLAPALRPPARLAAVDTDRLFPEGLLA